MVVGPGIITTGSLPGDILSGCFGSGEGPGGWLICGVFLAGGPPMIELMSEPIAAESSPGEFVMGGVAGVVGGRTGIASIVFVGTTGAGLGDFLEPSPG